MKEKIEKIFEKYGLSKEHSLTPILSKLFEEEKRIDRGEEILEALRLHKGQFLSDLTELEEWAEGYNHLPTELILAKLQEIKAKYKEKNER